MEPTIGRVVIYKPTEEEKNTMRAKNHADASCNVCEELPAIVTNVFNATLVNLKVLLDGEGTLWATSRPEGNLEGHWHWPEKH